MLCQRKMSECLLLAASQDRMPVSSRCCLRCGEYQAFSRGAKEEERRLRIFRDDIFRIYVWPRLLADLESGGTPAEYHGGWWIHRPLSLNMHGSNWLADFSDRRDRRIPNLSHGGPA